MFPIPTRDNIQYHRRRHVELASKLGQLTVFSCVSCSNIKNIIFRKFSSSIIRTFSSRFRFGVSSITNASGTPFGFCISPTSQSSRLPAFGIPISNIILMRARKKVIWSYTFFIIAMMAYAQTFWDSAVMQLVRIVMSRIMDFIMVKTAISSLFSGTKPHPTVSYLRTMRRYWPVFINAPPESFFWSSKPFVGTGLRTVLWFICSPGFDHKSLAASQTIKVRHSHNILRTAWKMQPIFS